MSLKGLLTAPHRRLLYGVLCLMVAIALQGCGDGKGRSLIMVGSDAPQFSLKLFDGTDWSLKSHKDSPLVIAFMASWCPCSNESIPFINEAFKRFSPKGVRFILIGIQDSASNFKGFIDSKAVDIPAGYDEGDRIAALYGVDAPPVTVFIDRNHRVKRVYFGNIKEVGTEFYNWIEEVL